MAIKLVLTSQEILDKVFSKRDNGYDSFQVDSFLDKVLLDYRVIEKNVLIDKSEFDSLNTQITNLKNKVTELEIENSKYKAKLGGIQDNPNASLENINLLKRINALEIALYNAGVNPGTVK